MNFTTQRAKNIISKDNKLSRQSATEIIDNCDFETFKTLCDNSEHIFDFIADKIINNLTEATNGKNLKNTFEFAKIYNCPLGEFILKSWLKHADEDLTDEILQIFENGTTEQKIYAAKYFEKINDPPALELLNKYALDEDENLSAACAATLFAFGDNTVRNQIVNGINKENDDFKKYFSLKFLINFSAKEDLPLITQELEKSPFGMNLAQDILYKYTFSELLELISFEKNVEIFDEIVSSYPEDAPLDTICDFNIYDFVDKLFEKKNQPLVNRILCDLKNVLEIICEGNIYTYDLGKDCLSEIKNIYKKLEKFQPDEELVLQELNHTPKRILRALNTLSAIGKDNTAQKIKELSLKTDNAAILCECAKTASAINRLDILDKEKILNNISDINAGALFKSYFN